ncbi:MAG: Rpp14/Pop5 family protein [Candidatus Aenigmatarchaeota archaeon]
MRILPTLREKKRYILIEAIDGNFEKENFLSVCEKLFGKFYLDKFKLDFLDVKGKLVIKCSHKYVSHVLTAILFMDCVIKAKKISGTIKSIREILK